MGIALVLAAATLGFTGCLESPVAGTKDEKSESEDSDKQIAEWLSEPDNAEARNWLQTESHVLFEGDKEAAVKLVSDLYSAGATKVWVIGISEIGDAEVAAAFVAVLPADAASRKRVFAVESDFQKLIGEDPSRDTGQKYLHFSFD
jgi:hypothetical protein